MPGKVFSISAGEFINGVPHSWTFVETQTRSLADLGLAMTLSVVYDRTSIRGIARNVRRLRAEMYCEELGFQYMGAVVVQNGSDDGSHDGTLNGGSGGGGQDSSGGGIQDDTAAGDSGDGGQTSPTGRFTRLPMSRPQTVPNVLDRARLNFRT